jgi:hypothetical protein
MFNAIFSILFQLYNDGQFYGRHHDLVDRYEIFTS